jgi:hypothetical protein
VSNKNYIVKSSLAIVFSVCSFLKHWAGLNNVEEKKAICAGADQIMKKVSEVAGTRSKASVAGRSGRINCLLLTAG